MAGFSSWVPAHLPPPLKIDVHEVLKKYGGTRALDGVSMTIEPGQVVALLGPNGAGKTTLLRCLAGISGPNSGDILFDGVPFKRDSIQHRRRLLFLPDFPALIWDQSVLRNLGILLRLYGADGPGVEDRIRDLLIEFDLLAAAEVPVQVLSRGQLYKAALIGLIAVDPELWLLDEPLASGMDPLGLSAFRRHAQAAARRGHTVIYSTQLLDVVERFADRVGVIHQGKLRAFDTLPALRAAAGTNDNVLEELFIKLRQEGQ